MKAYRFFVSGRVQGVGFRAYVERLARREALAGWVRNRRDGRVEALLAPLDDDASADIAAQLETGPGHVENVTCDPAEEDTGDEFSIRETF
jgi:acylphosphatase